MITFNIWLFPFHLLLHRQMDRPMDGKLFFFRVAYFSFGDRKTKTLK